jgi:hypothetical protein
MTRPWQYPIYLIQHGGGYASLVDDAVSEQSSQSLVVCRDEEKAMSFMAACELLGKPRELQNDREFGWLLQSLRSPVTNVVFDPSVTVEQDESAWRVSVREILEQHLVADNSPWNYPVYAVAQGEGFISIEGQASDGRALTALGLFTDELRIEAYLEEADEAGTPCALTDLGEARTFLEAMSIHATAIALNPTVVDGQRTAKHCFAIETLLEQYLVVPGEHSKETS